MSKGKNQHVVTHSGGWAIKGAGNNKYTKVTETKKRAIDYPKSIAKNQHLELLNHGKDGKIQEKNTYGPDQCPPIFFLQNAEKYLPLYISKAKAIRKLPKS